MQKFPHPVLGQDGASDVAQRAVHVPLDVFDVRAFKDLLDLGVHAVAYLLAAYVQNVLLPRLARLPVRDLDRPVGMRTVQVAVRRNHLRLEPDSKLEAQPVHFVHEARQPALELVLVYEPVAE